MPLPEPDATTTLGAGPVIAAYDGSDHARDALTLASTLVRALDAELVVAVVHAPDRPDGAQDGPIRRTATILLDEAPIPDDLVRVRKVAVAASSPPRGLHRLAERERAAVVVVGSTHRGMLGQIVPGSVALRLLHGGPCAVAVAPAGYAATGEAHLLRVTAAFTATPEGRSALAVAAGLAAVLGARLRVLGVMDPVRVPLAHGTVMLPVDAQALAREDEEAVRRALAAAIAGLPPEVRVEYRALLGDPARAIVARCVAGTDLLVCGSRGYGPLGVVLLGSVSTRLIRKSPVPVLVVPRPARDEQPQADDAGPTAGWAPPASG